MKFRPSTIILIAVVVLTTAKFSLGQTTAITEKDYWADIVSGYAATRSSFPRRETKTYDGFSGGRMTYSRTEMSEFRSKDTYRTTKTVVRDGTTVVTEAIQIGPVRYCRENTAEWKSSGCYENPPAPLGDAYETSYSLETTKDTRTYIRTAKSQKKESDKSEPTKFVTEDRFVLNSDGAVRERSIVKIVTETKSIFSRDTSKFEYGVTLKPIEAPIK